MYKKLFFMIDAEDPRKTFYAKEKPDEDGKIIGYYLVPEGKENTTQTKGYIVTPLISIKPKISIANEYGFVFNYTYRSYKVNNNGKVVDKVLKSIMLEKLFEDVSPDEYILYRRSWIYVEPAHQQDAKNEFDQIYFTILASTVNSEIISVVGTSHYSSVWKRYATTYIYDIYTGYSMSGTNVIDYRVKGEVI